MNPANSDMGNGFKKIQNVPLKKSFTAEKTVLKGTRITQPYGWITSPNFYSVPHFKTSRFFKKSNLIIMKKKLHSICNRLRSSQANFFK